MRTERDCIFLLSCINALSQPGVNCFVGYIMSEMSKFPQHYFWDSVETFLKHNSSVSNTEFGNYLSIGDKKDMLL